MTLGELLQVAKIQCFDPDRVEIVMDDTMGYRHADVEISTALLSDDGLIERDEGQEETPVKVRRKVVLIS